MIGYRPFINSDPPHLAEIWRSQPPCRALVQPMTASTLEDLVFSKPYFDRLGLIVATEDDKFLGFAHAGFGPAEDGRSLCIESGATCMMMVAPHEDQNAIAAGLIAKSEAYLLGKGAQTLYGGCTPPITPFYLGLYAGGQLSGVLQSDQTTIDHYQAAGYIETARWSVLQKHLTGFHPTVDRQQMKLRRSCRIEVIVDPLFDSWWLACCNGTAVRTLIRVASRDGTPSGRAMFWDMEPLASSWGVRAVGLLHLEIEAQTRRLGMATFLLNDAFRRFQSEGVVLVETHVRTDDNAALRLFNKLGFSEVDQSVVLCKAV